MASVAKAKKSMVESRESRAKPTTHNKPNGEPCDWVERVLSGSQLQAPSTQLLDVDLIEASPYQPRQDFGDEDLSDLASITAGPDGQAVGLIHAIVVRPAGGGYELVAGERRLRRAKIVGCRTIRAEIQPMSDEEASQKVLEENESRKPLNPIERARWIQATRARTGESQAALGARLHPPRNQAWVSDQERLLALPAAVQARIISGEIPWTTARGLVPLAGHAKICEAAVKEALRSAPMGRTKDDEGGPLRPEDLADGIESALRQHAPEMRDSGYDRTRGLSVKSYRPTDEEREQLGIVSVKCPYTGSVSEFATNVKLWDKLTAAHKAKLAEQAAKREEKKAGKGQAKAAAGEPQKLSAEEIKRREAEEKRRKKEREELQAKQLWHLAVDWRRWAIAKALTDGEVSYEDGLRLLACCAALWSHGFYDELSKRSARVDAKSALRDAIQACKGKTTGSEHWTGLRTVADLDMEDLAHTFAARYFFDGENGPCRVVPDGLVLAIADDLGIDMELLWADGQCGPYLSERYWNLRAKDQLAEYCRQHKVETTVSKKSDMVAALLARIPADDDDANTAAAKALPCPKGLAKPKRPK